MNNIANQCEVTHKAARNTMSIPYSTNDYQQAVIHAKNQREIIRAMFDIISKNGGNTNAPPEYWDKIKPILEKV